MSDIAWETEHSVEATATLAFAWTYMTDVRNWDDPPAEFTLHGPFVSGSSGTTEMPGQESRHWRLRDVEPPDSYTIAIALDEAVILCKWTFTELADCQTRLTQRITLEGDNASACIAEVQQAFEHSLEEGMSRIANAIGEAYARDSTNAKTSSQAPKA